jgi:regulator of sigma E protease
MTILVAILGLIILIVIHELGHMLVAKALGVRVPEFGIGFGPALFKRRFGKTVYSFRIILLGGFARMAGMGDDAEGPDTYPSKPAWRRAAIIFAGPFANLLAAVVIFAVIFLGGAPTGAAPVVDEVVPNSMAEEVGLRPGDRLVEADGQRVAEWRDFGVALAGKQPGDEVTVAVERGGERREFTGRLQADPENPERAIVGIRPELTYVAGPLEALWQGTVRTVQTIALLGMGVWAIFSGIIAPQDAVASPIGIVSVTSDFASQGVMVFASLMALISVNLAVFNLLPILPLDGGHLLFILLEKLRGRPVSPATVNRYAAFGLALMLMLFLFATYADLSKIIQGQPFIPEQRP